ncbi:18682_t:CDS:2 [Funneliformis geosporum]|uniref:18682_t:CDS:1 n=1 Tax=Funneliformis geosporum TaxID=1117311 RepID=A0A9W4STF1_9GLOM|nr:18682_t:CDS:2 [Funneliformis geosporum]
MSAKGLRNGGYPKGTPTRELQFKFQHKERYIAIPTTKKSRPLQTLTAFTSSIIVAL